MMPHYAYSITINVCTITLVDISRKQRSKIPLSNEQDSKENKAIFQLCQNMYVQFKWWHK